MSYALRHLIIDATLVHLLLAGQELRALSEGPDQLLIGFYQGLPQSVDG